MNLKTICLAAATVVSLAAPAAAMAQPWGYGRGYYDDDDWRRHEWRERQREWREHRRWEEGARWNGYYGGRCVIEERGYRNYWGDWVRRPVRVCYR